MAFGGGGGPMGGVGDKGLHMSLMDTFRQAWADEDLRKRILFILAMFGVFVLGVHVPVPIPGVTSDQVFDAVKNNPYFQLLDTFGGGGLKRVSVFALGLNPYITASIIIQIMTTSLPKWKLELQEGGEYARRQQNRRTRMLTLALCVFQSLGLLQMITGSGIPISTPYKFVIAMFWTAGAMFMLWLGEQISEKGIGNGVSLMIFAGIVVSLPGQTTSLINWASVKGGTAWISVVILGLIFIGATWLIVLFTTAQRRIPIQHMRRQVGTKVLGGQTSYLPLSVNMAGVIPIIFAVSLIYMPAQFGAMFAKSAPSVEAFLTSLSTYLNPGTTETFRMGPIDFPKAIIGSLAYMFLIFFFTYFYTAIQYNVEDISNNLKRSGSFIPGVRPGKQTKDFLDGVISRITVAGATFLTCVALVQYIAPRISGIPSGTISVIGGTSLLIMVSVALETMRQIEANLLMKHYGQQ